MSEQFAGRVIAENRLTIPSHVREELDLGPGDYVTVELDSLENE